MGFIMESLIPLAITVLPNDILLYSLIGLAQLSSERLHPATNGKQKQRVMTKNEMAPRESCRRGGGRNLFYSYWCKINYQHGF